MKITLFTSNKVRHNYLINLLSSICEELFVVQESGTIFPGIVHNHYNASPLMKNYFEKVNSAQLKMFGNSYVSSSLKKIKIFPMLMGDLNKCNISTLSDFLKSDLYVTFGCSYIKGEIVDYLINRKAINIHMGVSPYYRGTDCNFWALYEGNPHLVGATIHILSKGLDNGPILYHAMSNLKSNPFEYTMSTVKSAFHSLAEKIKDNTILEMDPLSQDKSKELRCSKKNDFKDNIINEFFKKKINLESKKFQNSLLHNPFFLNK